MSNIKNLAGQTAVYGMSSIVGRLLNYLLVPLYTRIFSPAEYGVVTEFYAYVSFLIILFTYGMETAYFRFLSKTDDNEKVYRTALFSVGGSSLILLLILILFTSSIANMLGYPEHREYITWFALILCLDAISSFPFARLRAENKALRFAVFKIFNISVNILFNLFFLVYCPSAAGDSNALLHSFVINIYNPAIGIGYIFISNLAASLLTMLLMMAFMPRLFFGRFSFDVQLWKQMAVFAIPLLVAGLAGMVNETIDRIMLKYLVSDAAEAIRQVGIYGANYKLAIMMTLFIQMYRYAAEPFFFSQSSSERSKEVYASVMKYFVIVCSFIFLFIMVYIDVIKYFIGKEFHEGVSIVPVLLFANIFLGILFNLSFWYKITGYTAFGAGLAIFGAVITLALNYFLIPEFGYMGAAWTTFICYGSMMIVSYLFGQKYYPVKYDIAMIAGIPLLAAVFYFVNNFAGGFLMNDIYKFMAGTFFLFLFSAMVFLITRAKKIVP